MTRSTRAEPASAGSGRLPQAGRRHRRDRSPRGLRGRGRARPQAVQTGRGKMSSGRRSRGAGRSRGVRVGGLRVSRLRRQGRRAQAVRRPVRQAEVHLPDVGRPGARQGAGGLPARHGAPLRRLHRQLGRDGRRPAVGHVAHHNFADLEEPLVTGGQIDGQQYFIPADWGFSSPLPVGRGQIESPGRSSTTTATRGRSPGGTARSRTSSSGAT